MTRLHPQSKDVLDLLAKMQMRFPEVVRMVEKCINNNDMDGYPLALDALIVSSTNSDATGVVDGAGEFLQSSCSTQDQPCERYVLKPAADKLANLDLPIVAVATALQNLEGNGVLCLTDLEVTQIGGYTRGQHIDPQHLIVAHCESCDPAASEIANCRKGDDLHALESLPCGHPPCYRWRFLMVVRDGTGSLAVEVEDASCKVFTISAEKAMTIEVDRRQLSRILEGLMVESSTDLHEIVVFAYRHPPQPNNGREGGSVVVNNNNNNRQLSSSEVVQDAPLAPPAVSVSYRLAWTLAERRGRMG